MKHTRGIFVHWRIIVWIFHGLGVVPDYLYADGAHFFEPVYTWFNVELLSLLSSFLML